MDGEPATGNLVRFMDQDYTVKQGQYLAFIYYYTKINRCAPAEADFQRYFGVSPPSVHEMIKTLERRRFIEKVPGLGDRFASF